MPTVTTARHKARTVTIVLREAGASVCAIINMKNIET